MLYANCRGTTRLKITLLLIAIFVLASCAQQSGPRAPTKFEQLRPRSILVVPIVNKSVDVQAPTSLLTTLPTVLGNKGYYVFPINTVKTVLDHEGFYEPAEVHNQPPESLAAMFGADSILYVTINDWTSQYVLLSTTTIVDFNYQLVSRDGHTIWSERKRLSYTPQSNDTGNAFANLINSAISAAMERMAPNYLPLARQANQEAFTTGRSAIPPGPYSEHHAPHYSQLEGVQDETPKQDAPEAQ